MTPARVAASITSTRSDLTPPSAPTGLSGTPVAAGRIDLAWTASTDDVGVAGYNVYRDSTKINTAPIGSTSYSDTGLVGGANHTYTVKAVDASANESTASNTWSGAASSGALTTTYTYDAENRLTKLQSGSNVIGSYAYDGAGDRYSKTAGGVTTAYTLDLASGLPQVLTETAGSAVSSYAYAGGPLELDRSGTTNWYLTDTLGSVRLVTDSTGATPVTYAYSAFGSTRTSTGSLANEVRFTGERTDTESGLEFLRARTYDPATGTFLQRDSWGITPTSSQSIDAYVYTANNPINATDPSGHCGVFDPLGCASDAIGGVGNTLNQAGQVAVQKGSDFAGGVGNAWAQTGGGIVNNTVDWVQKNPATTAFILGAGLCVGSMVATAGATTGICLAMAQGAAIGGGIYVGATVGGNAVSSKPLTSGLNSERLFLNMDIGGLSGGAGKAVSSGVTRLAGGGLSATETVVTDMGVGGAARATTSLLARLATGTLSAASAFTPASSFLGPLIKAAAKQILKPLSPIIPRLPRLPWWRL